jgi:hypothetical protein
MVKAPFCGSFCGSFAFEPSNRQVIDESSLVVAGCKSTESPLPRSNRETLLAAIIQFFKDNPGCE